ncbi:MAG: dihydrolipoamide acetyltransferase family protein [Bacteroidales bacterium]
MAQFELKMPKMGESITEATITRWLKNVGDTIELDDPILEIATDKVDSEIPSPVEGVLKEQKFNEGDTVAVNTIIAIIDTQADEGEEEAETAAPEEQQKQEPAKEEKQAVAAASSEDQPVSEPKEQTQEQPQEQPQESPQGVKSYDQSGRFFSPLVRSIAKEEGISMEELAGIPGTGQNDRLTKNDLIEYLKTRGQAKTEPYGGQQVEPSAAPRQPDSGKPATHVTAVKPPKVTPTEGDQIIEMGRMRKLIAEHMVMSEATSVHINLFADADMSRIVSWRNKHKGLLAKRENQKLTYTPIFIEAIGKALRDFPMVNVSVSDDKIIVRKNINVGMAAATPEGNLIVPVIKNVDHKSLLGIAKEVNDLATRSRNNKLKPDEIQGGTFTLTNFGIFGLTSGTPIINQPQVAILGVGAIIKKPVVIESEHGDTMGIRPIMTLSLACDHRVVDGALGGQFLQRLVHYLENFDTDQTI